MKKVAGVSLVLGVCVVLGAHAQDASPLDAALAARRAERAALVGRKDTTGVPGRYAVRGTSDRRGAYGGTATLEARGDELHVTVTRTFASGAETRTAVGSLEPGRVSLREQRALAIGVGPTIAGAAAVTSRTEVVRTTWKKRASGELVGGFARQESGAARQRELGRETLVPDLAGLDGEIARIDSESKWLQGRGAKPRVVVSVSVDWEGSDLEEENLRAFEQLRADLPRVPLTHFLNGAYFTKKGAVKADVVAKIRRALRPGDELGLHVHCWKSLVEAAGVTFKTRPTFWGDRYPLQAEAGDYGHEVELPAYSTEELREIVALGRAKLQDAGFTIGASFRAGGWTADPKVLAAIRAEGFLVDSSAVDNKWHIEELRSYALLGRIHEIWPDTTETTQPYPIATPFGSVLEMPDTGALADYVTPDEMVGHLKRMVELAKKEPRLDVFAHIGFHQESAGRYAARVTQALRALRDEGAIEIVTLDVAAARARAQLR